MKYSILPTDKDLQHYGVLGMKWGIRRYQPYSVVPRGSGEGGKEIGVAARKNTMTARVNVYSGVKTINRKRATYERLRSKKVASDTMKVPLNEKTQARYEKYEKIIDEAFNEFKKADSYIGKENVDKALNDIIRSREIANTTVNFLAFTPIFGAALSVHDVSNLEKTKNFIEERRKSDNFTKKSTSSSFDFDKEYKKILSTAKTDEEKDRRLRALEEKRDRR